MYFFVVLVIKQLHNSRKLCRIISADWKYAPREDGYIPSVSEKMRFDEVNRFGIFEYNGEISSTCYPYYFSNNIDEVFDSIKVNQQPSGRYLVLYGPNKRTTVWMIKSMDNQKLIYE